MINFKDGSTELLNIPSGNVFKYCGKRYIKTNKTAEGKLTLWLCVDLANGNINTFSDITEVIPITLECEEVK